MGVSVPCSRESPTITHCFLLVLLQDSGSDATVASPDRAFCPLPATRALSLICNCRFAGRTEAILLLPEVNCFQPSPHLYLPHSRTQSLAISVFVQLGFGLCRVSVKILSFFSLLSSLMLCSLFTHLLKLAMKLLGQDTLPADEDIASTCTRHCLQPQA